MDPDANLREQRELAARLLATPADAWTDDRLADALRLAELVEGLDGWLTASGALPDDWRD